jgi:hypothetical protein
MVIVLLDVFIDIRGIKRVAGSGSMDPVSTAAGEIGASTFPSIAVGAQNIGNHSITVYARPL